ncbi:hypothetical protein ACW185_05810 [Limosilactobacillus fermentum]
MTAKKKKIVARPQITSRGFVFVKTNRELMNQRPTWSKRWSKTSSPKGIRLRTPEAKRSRKLNRFFLNQTKRHPVILPVIMEINERPKRSRTNTEGDQGSYQGTGGQETGQKAPQFPWWSGRGGEKRPASEAK